MSILHYSFPLALIWNHHCNKSSKHITLVPVDLEFKVIWTWLQYLIYILMFDCMIIEYRLDVTLNMPFLFIDFNFLRYETCLPLLYQKNTSVFLNFDIRTCWNSLIWYCRSDFNGEQPKFWWLWCDHLRCHPPCTCCFQHAHDFKF
jgi:hypothetical protein